MNVAQTRFWIWLDRVLLTLLAVYGIVVLVGLLIAPHFFLPAEDAVILHQFSRNLAQHGSITYYAGGPHAEGATDFAWMVLVSVGIRCGISPAVFTALASVVSLLLLGFVLLRLAALRVTPLRLILIAGAAGLLPQIIAVGAGFAVLPDALLLTVLVWCFVRQRAALTPLVAFALCLLRPDGVVFAVPLLVATLVARGKRRQRALYILGLFVLPGIAYFVWRATYFHALFPLPFTVKADVHRTLGVLVLHSLTSSLKYLLFDAALLVPLLGVGLLRRTRRENVEAPSQLHPRTLALMIALLVIPTLFYWAMRLDQNVGDRFFFYLPLAAAVLLALHWPMLAVPRQRLLFRIGFVAFLLFLLGPLLREVRTFRDYQFRNVESIATALGRLPTRGSLLTTEAGILAYGSGWVAYDAWGLNTARFARHFIQPSDVVALRPDLIVLHPFMSESCVPQTSWLPAYSGRSGPHLSRNLILGARDSGDYQLWLISFGSEYYRERNHWGYGEGDRECFLIRTDSPRFAGIAAILAQHDAVGPPQSIALERERLLSKR